MFISTYATDGEPLHAERFGGTADEYLADVSPAGADVVLAYDANDHTAFRGVAVETGGGRDACVARLPIDSIGR